MPDLSGVLVPPRFADWVYDPQRDRIHIVTTDGQLHSWSVGEQRLVGSLAIGGTPGVVDIFPNGAFLLVGNSERIVTSPTTAAEKTYAAVITKVDLDRLTVQEHRLAVSSFDGGIGSIAAGADGGVLFTTYVQGSGGSPLREFSPATNTFRTVNGFGSLASGMGSSSHLIPSEDRRYVLIQELFSTGTMHLYDTLTDSRLGLADAYAFQSGLGDISTAAGLVADVLYNNAYVYNFAMRQVTDLSRYSSTGSLTGAEFNDGGHQLFLWQGTQKKVVVLDTLTWQPVATLDLITATPSGHVGQPFGSMDVASNGRVLLLDFGNGLEFVDLSARLRIDIAGDSTSRALHGAIGSDRLAGGGGQDTAYGYAGEDTLQGDDGADYLRGDEGNDSISGGADFDDINGNMGDDTASGGLGDDWVVGGKDNDRLLGDAGNDLVYGNLGNDTCDGGDGADIVRGGQGDDTVSAGAGADFVSGDLGNDTLMGGAGADVFSTFAETGIDRVLDFSLAEGDRVQLASGTQYTLAQVGADTVINMTGGGQMILVGVQMSTLAPGWIFGN